MKYSRGAAASKHKPTLPGSISKATKKYKNKKKSLQPRVRNAWRDEGGSSGVIQVDAGESPLPSSWRMVNNNIKYTTHAAPASPTPRGNPPALLCTPKSPLLAHREGSDWCEFSPKYSLCTSPCAQHCSSFYGSRSRDLGENKLSPFTLYRI